MKKAAVPKTARWGSRAAEFFSNLMMPSLDWVQVEVTACCNAACTYCPRTVYQKAWQAQHMPLDLFRRLIPAFRKAELVYLQGWGEPLLHPHFFEMARIAKECGRLVGTTTNGMLCTDDAAEQMVGEGLNVVAFSLAGTTDDQDEIRRGTRIREVLKAIRLLAECKRKHESPLPEIHVAYMWLRSQFDRIKDLPALLEGAGASHVVVTTLDFVPRRALAAEVLHAASAEEENFLRRIASEVVEDGERRGLKIAFRLISTFRAPGECTENVTRSCFVSSHGLVSPCVFRNIPVREPEPAGEGDLRAPEGFPYGDLNSRGISSILAGKTRKDFLNDHARGGFPPSCAGCPKLVTLPHGC